LTETDKAASGYPLRGIAVQPWEVFLSPSAFRNTNRKAEVQKSLGVFNSIKESVYLAAQGATSKATRNDMASLTTFAKTVFDLLQSTHEWLASKYLCA
jgi:hypothetical protein